MASSLKNLGSSKGKDINLMRRHKRRLKVEQEHSGSTRKKKLKLRQRLTQHSKPSLKSSTFHQLLQEIHSKAWGKLWPTKACVIRRREIFPDETNTGDDDEHIEIDDAKDDGTEDDDDGAEDNDDDDFGKIPEETTLECLCNADLLQRAFNISGPPFEYIVICEEYEFLRELLEAEIGDYILTGQPGTGKTVFLIRLLIYRLQLELPTAVQFSPNKYIVFGAGGASICATDDSIDHWRMLPEGCWCLTDGNAEVGHPCEPFQRNGLRTILITPPRPERFKKWRTTVGADTVITALPRAVEIVAIAEMNGWKASDAIAIMRKWGPCTRTVLFILEKPGREKSFERFAAQASVDIYDDPSHVVSRELGKLPAGKGSTLLFISPIRSNHDPDYTDSKFIIPTIYLSKIFDDKSQGILAEARMRLYETFSLHPMTRTSAGWMHEKNMHLEMCTGKKRFKIWNTRRKSHMRSAPLAPGGTASALRTAACNRPSSFYWFPSIVNFVGIDGVLVNGDNIYALQPTIADTHDGPLEGLRKVWKTIGAAVAELFNWHFVLVSDNEALANKYAKELGTKLSNVYLGRKRLRVSVRVCVLKCGS